LIWTKLAPGLFTFRPRSLQRLSHLPAFSGGNPQLACQLRPRCSGWNFGSCSPGTSRIDIPSFSGIFFYFPAHTLSYLQPPLPSRPLGRTAADRAFSLPSHAPYFEFSAVDFMSRRSRERSPCLLFTAIWRRSLRYPSISLKGPYF